MNTGLSALAALAQRQMGQIVVEQALDAGLTRSTIQDLMDSQLVEWVVPRRVLGLCDGPHPSAPRPVFPRTYASWLLLQPHCAGWQRRLPDSGVVSHTSAVRLYRIGDQPGPTMQFTVSPTTAVADTDAMLHRRELGAHEWRMVDGLPVTTPARTLADLVADTSLDDQDIDRVAEAFLRRGLVTAAETAAARQRPPGHQPPGDATLG